MRARVSAILGAAALWLAVGPVAVAAQEGGAQAQSQQESQAERRLLEVGRVGPDFTLPLVAGGEVTLANLLKFGKAVLVGFFSIEPEKGGTDVVKLQKLHEQYESKGLSTIIINPVDSARDVKDFVEESKIQFMVAVDGKETNRAVTNVYRARTLPAFYLLDPSGKVLWRGIGLKEAPLKEALEKAGLK